MWAPAHVGLCIAVLHGGWLEGSQSEGLAWSADSASSSRSSIMLERQGLLVQHSMPSAEAFGHGLCSMPLACCLMEDSTRQGVHMHAVSGPS